MYVPYSLEFILKFKKKLYNVHILLYLAPIEELETIQQDRLENYPLKKEAKNQDQEENENEDDDDGDQNQDD